MNKVPSVSSFGPDSYAAGAEDHGFRQKIDILLVDDSPESLVALEALLEGPDRHLVKVSSGQEALRYLLTHDVGLIVLDVKMAGMSGYEAAALIRKRERTRNVPIIFLTAYSKDDEDITRGYSYGAAGYMFKPIVPMRLQSQVSCFVELAKKTEELRWQKEELERIEAELIRTKAAAILIQHAPAPAFIANVNGIILQVNDRAAELLGLKLEETIEQSVSRMLNPDDTWRVTATLREVVERGVVREVSLRVCSTRADTAMTLHASPLRDEADRVIGTIGLLCDRQAYERVAIDLQRAQAALSTQNGDLEALKDIVLARDLETQRLEHENRRLRQELKNLKG